MAAVDLLNSPWRPIFATQEGSFLTFGMKSHREAEKWALFTPIKVNEVYKSCAPHYSG